MTQSCKPLLVIFVVDESQGGYRLVQVFGLLDFAKVEA